MLSFISMFSRVLFNPVYATTVFLDPLKASENIWFSDVFRGYRKRPVTWNGLIRMGYVFTDAFIYLFIYLFIYFFIYLLTYLFIVENFCSIVS